MSDTPHYDRLGGEQKIRELVDRFYELMDAREDTQPLRQMHAKDLRVSRDKLFMFLSGWLGGPQLYIEKYGHPRLRQRHMPFEVDSAARDQWMGCMVQAMEDVGIEEGMRKELEAAFFKTADFMRNQPEA
ncbi:MAG: group II truncated hemoglobin [Pseudomonadota bacterium]